MSNKKMGIAVAVALVLAMGIGVLCGVSLVSNEPVSVSGKDTVVPNTAGLAFNYYMSLSRRQPLEDAIQEVGGRFAGMLLGGGIPSRTRSWQKENLSPAPQNGYGILESLPGLPGDKYVGLNVKFTNGQVDLGEGILGMSIMTVDRIYTIDGRKTFTEVDRVSAETARSYGWVVSDRAGRNRKGFQLVDRGSSKIAPWGETLDRGKDYTVEFVEGDSSREVDDVDTIRACDGGFLLEFTTLNPLMNGSTWVSE